MNTKHQNSIVGKFFHSKESDEKTIKWQGVVLANPEPGYYLVQLFEWLMGAPSVQHLVRIESMIGWNFYDTDEDMREYRDTYGKIVV